MLEQVLQLLADKLEIKVLSIFECYKVAEEKLLMSPNDCEAALRYLAALNIIF